MWNTIIGVAFLAFILGYTLGEQAESNRNKDNLIITRNN